PDSGLKELDPREIERVVAEHTAKVRPDVLVTYAVHGVSGFHDHLVTHAVVKRAYLELRDQGADYLKRLAFFTLTEEQAAKASGTHQLSGSKAEDIDCIMTVDDEDMEAFRRALDCYATYQEMIRKTGVRDSLDRTVAFEFFQEDFTPPVGDICEGLARQP
ncbi:MAG: PIG-L family deacetylase, partial [Planctomycetota bacterium]